MGLLDGIFWDDWEERLADEADKFVTPNDPVVVEEANKIDINGARTERDVALDTWRHVARRIDYELSKEWKEPRQTLQEGVADCEDLTFLIASLLPNLGVEKSFMHAGDLIFEDGDEQKHSWNVVGGMIVDATGMPEDIVGLKYRPLLKFRVVSNG